jgi:protein-disulfide isomerase
MRQIATLLTITLLLPAAARAGETKPKPALKPAATPAPDAVALIDGAPITAAAFDEAVEPRLSALRAQEYELKRQVLEELISQRLMEREAAARSVTADVLAQQEVDAKVVPPTDAEVKALVDGAKGRYPGRSEAEMASQARAYLQQQKGLNRRAEFARELRAKYPVRVLLEAPRVAVDPGDAPSRGPKTAPITIVEFSDFQCPYCGRVMPTLRQLEQRYGDSMRIVFRDFPLPIHPQAPKAAEAAACAHEQGKFWEMHDRLFASQGAIQVADLKTKAVEIGLNADAFNQCLDSGKHEAVWKKGVEEGSRYGVTGTPAFFVNGRLISGARPIEDFARVIDEELERAGLPVPPPLAVAKPPAPGPAPQPPASPTPPVVQEK